MLNERPFCAIIAANINSDPGNVATLQGRLTQATGFSGVSPVSTQNVHHALLPVNREERVLRFR